jgi:hypothetical protein
MENVWLVMEIVLFATKNGFVASVYDRWGTARVECRYKVAAKVGTDDAV